MPYKTERELQLELSAVDFEFFDSHPISFFRREVRVGGCIPDLVSIYFNNDPTMDSWTKKWAYKHSYIIWLFRKWGTLSLEQIASLCFESQEHISPYVQDLRENDILFEGFNGKLHLSEQIAEIKSGVVAVEAKLSKWKDALWQAIRYKDFANIVFVAMDSTQIPGTSQVLQEFQKHQIGLCAVSPGNIKWIIYPELRESGLCHEKEYLVMSAMIPKTQTLWSRRNRVNASSQA